MGTQTCLIDEQKKQIISLEESLMRKSKEQDYKRCCSIYFNTFLWEIDAKPLDPNRQENFDYEELFLGFHAPEPTKFLKKLRSSKFFDINSINLVNIKEKNKDIINFVYHSTPNVVYHLSISFTYSVKICNSRFLKSVIRLSSKATKSAIFQCFKLNACQLKRLITACRHVQTLFIEYCKLSVPSVPDFSRALNHSQIQKLSLKGSGQLQYSHWRSNLVEFKNLIQGLASSSDLRLSLRTIDIWCCQINENDAQEIFAKNQLEMVEILIGV
ncbi:unnamed protein product [Moneuplotes crassus]|uniref:Uncharacterized protein n=1 Tax=Euplotes crassus TaxID=5936 RepID=A0AAD1XBD7_EUPCR|nr:unnamed protein product [Moneuplotes crassus]